MASSSNSSMMSTIDSLKDKMSDEVYLALCEKMKELHTEQQRQDNDSKIPARIWFMTVRTFYVNKDDDEDEDDDDDDDDDGVSGERYRIEPSQKIVMMTRPIMECMKRIINDSPMHCMDYSFDNPSNRWIHVESPIRGIPPFKTHIVKVFRVDEV